MKFTWIKCGRQYVARFGRLSVTVQERGSIKKGLRWRVGWVFGNPNLGGGWHYKLSGATDEAEQIAEREARQLARCVGARSSKR